MEAQDKRRKVGKPVYPLSDPNKTGQLFYPVSLQGYECRMLYDTGASHCFLDADWAKQVGLSVRRVSGKATLHHFGGAAENAVKGVCHVDRLILAGKKYAWKFLAISPSPAPVVLGLSFILVHQPKIDLCSFALWVTEPCSDVSLRTALAVENDDTASGPSLTRISSLFSHHWSLGPQPRQSPPTPSSFNTTMHL